MQERDAGFREVLREAGIEPDPRLILEGDWSATSGYDRFRELLTREPGLTGIVAQNDRMAVGAIHAARTMGLRVPEDISIVGFDDMPLASYFDPPLTTVRQDTFAIGRACASMLIDVLDRPVGRALAGRLGDRACGAPVHCPRQMKGGEGIL